MILSMGKVMRSKTMIMIQMRMKTRQKLVMKVLLVSQNLLKGNSFRESP